MRRIARIVSALVTAFSLLLLAASATLWVRSYFVSDQISWAHPTAPRPVQFLNYPDERIPLLQDADTYGVTLGRGHVLLSVSQGVVNPGDSYWIYQSKAPEDPIPTQASFWNRLGFARDTVDFYLSGSPLSQY